MDKQRVARELVRLAKELVGGFGVSLEPGMEEAVREEQRQERSERQKRAIRVLGDLLEQRGLRGLAEYIKRKGKRDMPDLKAARPSFSGTTLTYRVPGFTGDFEREYQKEVVFSWKPGASVLTVTTQTGGPDGGREETRSFKVPLREKAAKALKVIGDRRRDVAREFSKLYPN